MSEKIHKFELSGLGKAPFRCVGRYSIPSPTLAEHNPTAYNNALAEMPTGFNCGACAYCGTPIMNNFLIKSSDGRCFSVGCECVSKTSDRGLVDKVKSLKREADRAKRAEKKEVERKAYLDSQKTANGGFLDWEWDDAHRENAKINKERELAEKAPFLIEIANRLNDGKGGFCDDISSQMKKGILPRGRGLDITADILAKQCGRRNSKAYNAELDRVWEIFESVA